jgi:hypothetical protein
VSRVQGTACSPKRWPCLIVANNVLSFRSPPQARDDYLLDVTDESECFSAPLLSGQNMSVGLVSTGRCHCAREQVLDDTPRPSKQHCQNRWIRFDNPEAPESSCIDRKTGWIPRHAQTTQLCWGPYRGANQNPACYSNLAMANLSFLACHMICMCERLMHFRFAQGSKEVRCYVAHRPSGLGYASGQQIF